VRELKTTYESDDASVALLGPYACTYKEISCAPRSMLIKRTPIRKGFCKIRS